VVANPECRRLSLYRAALEKRGAAPVVVTYSDVLAGKVKLPEMIRDGDIVRLESPGRDWDVEKALLIRGAKATIEEGRYLALSEAQVKQLPFEKGRLWPSRQWFHGLSALMHELEAQLQECAPHHLTHCPSDIVTFFDKPRCQAQLQESGVAVPAALPSPANFEAFMASLRSKGWQRAFLKLAHGSSAAGVVAFQTNGTQVKAVTTTEVVRCGGEVKLYNSRRLRSYETWNEVAELVNTLCRERLHIEKWFPKASLHGQTCDARIVVIGRRVWGGIARLSRSPLTNLHLLNDRAPLNELRAAMRPSDWDAACQSCEKAMAQFPTSLTGGLDVVFSPDFRRHAVLEINAWGDLLPGVAVQGQDTYGAQIEAIGMKAMNEVMSKAVVRQ
jgi:hypothetical protein